MQARWQWRWGVLAGCLALTLGCGNAPPGAQTEPPRKAFVICVVDQGRTRGITFTKPDELAELEAFFPGCRTAPSSPTYGRWETKYEITFTFPNGGNIGIRSDGTWWSAGDGDLRVKGDLAGYLQRKLPPDPEEPPEGEEATPMDAAYPTGPNVQTASDTTPSPAAPSRTVHNPASDDK